MPALRAADAAGFTLVELVIVIVIIGIIAAVATPAFKDIHVEAKSKVLRGSLTSIREAISHYQLRTAMTPGGAAWPTLDSLPIPGVVLTNPIPVNPHQAKTNAPDSVVEGFVRGQIVGDRGGWAYKPSTGEIWPNTSTTFAGSGCSGPTDLNENLW